MKLPILLILLIAWNSLLAQNHTTSDASYDHLISETIKSEYSEFELWLYKHALFLLDQPAFEIQLDAVGQLISDNINSALENKIKSVFAKALTTKHQSILTVQKMEYLCEEEKLISLCKKHGFPDITTITDPDNLASYLPAFVLSHKNNDSHQIDVLLQSMSNTTRVEFNIYRILQLHFQHITQFIEQTPVPKKGTFWERDFGYDTIKLIHNKYLKDQMTLYEYSTKFAAVYFSFLRGMQYMSQPYELIKETCHDEKHKQSCQRIGEILIDSKNLYEQGVGYELLIQIAQSKSEFKRAKQLIIAESRQKQYFECLNGFPEDLEDGIMHPSYGPTFFDVISKGGGASEGYKQASYAVYHAITDAGINMKYDPYACEEILSMDEPAFFKKYLADDTRFNAQH